MPDNEERSMIDVEMMKLIYEEGSGVMQKDHEEETGKWRRWMKRLPDMKKKIDVEMMKLNDAAEFRFNEDRSCRGKCRGKNKTKQRMIIDNSLF